MSMISFLNIFYEICVVTMYFSEVQKWMHQNNKGIISV